MAIIAPQIQQRIPFVDAQGRLTNEGLRSLNEAFRQQTGILNQIATILGITGDLETATQNAQTAANNANAAAATAQGAAETVSSESALATSGTSGLTITATDAGSSVTVAISGHTRIYGDGTTVAVSAGNIPGLSYSTTYYLYYLDASRAGGSVTFLASTSQSAAAQTGDTHSLGAVATPAAADPPVSGRPNLPPGVQEP
jgi:hypothetical protein